MIWCITFSRINFMGPTWWHFDFGRDLVVNGNEYSMKVRMVDSQGRLLFTCNYPLLLNELLHAMSPLFEMVTT